MWLKLGTALLALAAVLGAIWFLNREATTMNPAAPPRAARPPEPADNAPPAAVAPDETPAAERLKNTVVYVSDGQSLTTADRRRVRYLAVNAPADEPFAHEATELNRQLVGLKNVQIEPCAKRPDEENGALYAHVAVNGASVEEGLLALGLAEPRHDPLCLADCRKYWKLALEAFRDRRGLFKDAAGQPTPAAVADRLLGRWGIVTGVVHDVSEAADAINVNFGDGRVAVFSFTVSRADLEQFLRDKLDPRTLVGREIEVFGKVVSSYGPRIFGVCPTQIVRVSAP